MTRGFDLVVIGSGAAATTVAFECQKAGWQVAVVDSRPLGGTCALRGCDPKRVLAGAADLVEAVRRMKEKGVHGPASIDWNELIRFKRTFTEPYPAHLKKNLEEQGIIPISGRAKFIDRNSLQIGGDTLRSRYIVIATGARPATLNLPGEEHLLTSEQFMELDQLPNRLIFIGGGYIAFEFAHIAAAAGAQVTILHRGSRPLEKFDPDLVDRLVANYRAIGIDIRVNTPVVAIERSQASFTVRTTEGTFEADAVVHAAGRVPDLDDLNLTAGQIKAEKRGVSVNHYLQSISNPSVYAAGDASASGGPPLTPIAGYEGRVVAENLLNGNQKQTEYPNIPSVVFAGPPLASVGMQETQAREKGLQFRTNLVDSSQWYSSRRVGASLSGAKVLIENGTDRILGAHLLGLAAEEIINVFTLAIRSGTTASHLKETIFTYPTYCSDIRYML